MLRNAEKMVPIYIATAAKVCGTRQKCTSTYRSDVVLDPHSSTLWETSLIWILIMTVNC